MSYLHRAVALVFFSLTVITSSAASQRDPASGARSGDETTQHRATSSPAVGMHGKNNKRSCTQVCVKNTSGSYYWKDTAGTCNSETEQCKIQGPTSAVTSCKSDFDELLTQRGVCAPRKSRS